MPIRHSLLLAMGVVAVSFSAILIREAHAPALTVALYRNAFAAAMVAPLALALRREELRALGRRRLVIAVASGALLAAHFGTWIASLSYTTIAASVVLVTASPILVAAASSRWLGERLSRAAMAGILTGVAGAVVVSGGDLFVLSPRAAGGDLLAVAGAITAGGYFVAGRRLRREVSLLTYVALVYTTCAILLLPAALATGSRLTGLPGRTWVLLVLMAMVPQMLGHTVFNYLLKDVTATVVAVSLMGEPVGSALLALAFFEEVPPWTAVVGGLMILAGIYVAVTGGGRAGRRQAQPVTPLE